MTCILKKQIAKKKILFPRNNDVEPDSRVPMECGTGLLAKRRYEEHDIKTGIKKMNRKILVYLDRHKFHSSFMRIYSWFKVKNIMTFLKTRSSIKQYFREESIYKLNIGCGKNHLRGWLNADINKGEIYLNAVKRFPFENNTFDYINAEQFIQHIKLSQAKSFFRECFRVLKRGAVLRISTPDLEYHVKLYLGLCNEVDLAKYASRTSLYYDDTPERCEFINDYMILFGKQFNYDFNFLSKICHDAGFRNVERVKYGTSEHNDLRDIELHSNTQWVNKYLTLRVECTKSYK